MVEETARRGDALGFEVERMGTAGGHFAGVYEAARMMSEQTIRNVESPGHSNG